MKKHQEIKSTSNERKTKETLTQAARIPFGEAKVARFGIVRRDLLEVRPRHLRVDALQHLWVCVGVS